MNARPNVTAVKGFGCRKRQTSRWRKVEVEMLHKILMGLLIAGLAAMATADTVYKWVDSSGQIHFTDLPPRQGDAKILSVYQRESGTVDDGSSDDSDNSEEGDESASRPASQSGEATTPEPPVSEEAMASAEADAAKAKVEQCKAAQDRYQRYIDSRRLFRETADGKREYLTDQQLTEARARAKQAVTDYCS
jgi:hypothetical protein